jgi:hypothetical protein
MLEDMPSFLVMPIMPGDLSSGWLIFLDLRLLELGGPKSQTESP